MGIFDKIRHAIFGEANASPSVPSGDKVAQTPAAPSPASPQPAQSVEPAQAPVSPSVAPMPAPTTPPAVSPTPQKTMTSPVDVGAILDAAVKKSGQKLDWRHSIVDLMKALGMEATLEERKELAGELGYGGDVHDTVKMNGFLHKALMKRLADNGGKVPAELLG